MIRNDLFSIEVPGEATLITLESEVGDPEFTVAVRTELTSHETSPEAASVVLGLIEAVLPVTRVTREGRAVNSPWWPSGRLP